MNIYFRFLVLLISGYLFFGCHKKNNNVQPASAVSTMFNDNFVNNNNNWYEVNNDSIYVQVQNDSLFINNNCVVDAWDIFQYIAVDTTLNFSIKATITWKKGVTNHGFGLIWGFQNVLAYRYEFEIVQSGEYIVAMEQNGTYTNLANWTISNAINPKTNVLEIEKNGKQYIFYINGTQVFSTPYKPLLGYGIGFIVNNSQEVAITNLNVTQW
jgi:hypothetical protein